MPPSPPASDPRGSSGTARPARDHTWDTRAGDAHPAPSDDSITQSLRAQPRPSDGAPGSGGQTVAPTLDYPLLLPPVESDEIGRLGNYRVLKVLGRGGMGYVFLAEDIALRRRVALKVMDPRLDGKLKGWERFLREARIMASVKHEHLVTVYQAGQEGDAVYLAMELLHGRSMEDWVSKSGPPRPRVAARLAREVAAGLAEIHRHGLIHRDIKPANLWLEAPKGRVKILDFGLARLVDDDAKYTQAGLIVGTPAYMSPEQARGEKLDGRSDLFSLGGVLYYLCTGTIPFDSQNTMAMLTALAVDDPRPVRELNPAVPEALADLIHRLLAKNPADRPASARAVYEELVRFSESRTAATKVHEPTEPTGPAPAEEPQEADWQTAVMGDSDVAAARAVDDPDEGRYRTRVKVAVALAAIAVGIAGAALVRSLTAPAKPVAAAPEDGKTDRAPTPGAVVAPKGPAKAYLSEMKPTLIKNWIDQPPPPPDGPRDDRPPPPRFQGVYVRGELSPHGIFMHPPMLPNGGNSSLGYRLDKGFSSFQGEVSLNDGPPASETPLTYTVRGDNQILWKSRPLRSQADAQKFNVSVKGVETLTIEVDCPGHPHGAFAVWVEPQLTK
jgi:tRNA A-37 threonylcarbamoyl transferase component Bud32